MRNETGRKIHEGGYMREDLGGRIQSVSYRREERWGGYMRKGTEGIIWEVGYRLKGT